MNNFFVLFIISSLLFTGCSNRTPTYHGQTKEDLDFIYTQKKEAIENRRKSINNYYDLKYECKKYERYNYLDEAQACYQQLDSLRKNIRYYNVVVSNRNEIINELDRQEREIEEERLRAVKRFGKKALNFSVELLYYAAVIAGIAYTSQLYKKDEQQMLP